MERSNQAANYAAMNGLHSQPHADRIGATASGDSPDALGVNALEADTLHRRSRTHDIGRPTRRAGSGQRIGRNDWTPCR